MRSRLKSEHSERTYVRNIGRLDGPPRHPVLSDLLRPDRSWPGRFYKCSALNLFEVGATNSLTLTDRNASKQRGLLQPNRNLWCLEAVR